jgi:hypothetical protein
MSDNKLDEMLKLADPSTQLGLAALEASGVPWREAMGSATEVLLKLLNSLGKIVTIGPVVGDTRASHLPIEAAYAMCISEVRTCAATLAAMADIAEQTARERVRAANSSEVATPEVKVPSNQN